MSCGRRNRAGFALSNINALEGEMQVQPQSNSDWFRRAKELKQ
jgi:hypothetical protein